MDVNDIARQSLLYDFYGQLLTDRQGEITELYTQENYSLAEIAEELGISRQGVHDAVRNARKALEGYEEKLGLVQRFLRTEEAVSRIDQEILTMIGLLQKLDSPDTAAESPMKEPAGTETQELVRRLKKVKSIIDRLEE